jgi:hypothetical protein
MKKKFSLLAATALAGTMALTSLVPAAYAQSHGSPRLVADKGEQHEQMGRRGGSRSGPGGFLNLMCSDEGAPRLERILDKVGRRVELTDEQKALFDDFKTSALAAQTSYADTCVTPAREDQPDMIDMLKLRQTNMSARMTAMEEVLPSLETFYDSLTDEQKQQLRRDGHGKRFGDRGGDRRGDDDARGNGPRDDSPRNS